METLILINLTILWIVGAVAIPGYYKDKLNTDEDNIFLAYFIITSVIFILITTF